MKTETQMKLDQYQAELNKLNNEKNRISVDLQVNQKALESAQEQVKNIFGTHNIDELKVIKLKLQEDIAANEAKLQKTPVAQENNSPLFQ